MNTEFNEILTLKHNKIISDKIGNRIPVPESRDVLVNTRSATRLEFYSGGDHDFRPEYVVRMNKIEYDGEVDCTFRGKEYKITRAFEDFDEYDLIELTLSRKLKQN